MHHQFTALSIATALLLTACGGGSGDSSSSSTNDQSPPVDQGNNGNETQTLAAVIENVQIAQVHVLPAAGKTWTSSGGSTLQYRAIAGRPAMAILDLQLNGGQQPLLQGSLNGQVLGTTVLSQNANAFTAAPYSNQYPAATANTWYAMIPESWMQKGLQLRVQAAKAQDSAMVDVAVAPKIVFDLYTLPFYLFGATEATVPFDDVKVPPAKAQQELLDKWPIQQLNAQNHPIGRINWPYMVISPRNNQAAYRVNQPSEQKDGYANMSAVLNVLGVIRQANGDSSTANQYYAPIIQVDATGKFVSTGGGLGGGHIGTGDHNYKGIFIHEQGHAFGLPHAGESYSSSGYPYVGGSLNGSLLGFDLSHNVVLPNTLQPSAASYKGCEKDTFAGYSRQLDKNGLCIKQDPMQSGSGDQEAGYLYTHFSDYNIAKIQRYFEGETTLNNQGGKNYSGGRIFADPAHATGYKRWDSLASQWVTEDPTITTDKGLYGIGRSLPLQKNVDVYTIIFSVSKANTTDVTQIYPVLGKYSGNLIKTFNPLVSTDLQEMTPNTGKYPWYCRASGCDYSLRLSYANGSTQYVAVQGGFRNWFKEQEGFDSSALDPKDSDSYDVWGVNVPAQQRLTKVELLDTPMIWKGLPSNPTVLATRIVN